MVLNNLFEKKTVFQKIDYIERSCAELMDRMSYSKFDKEANVEEKKRREKAEKNVRLINTTMTEDKRKS